jgi:hypothetical protein
MALVVAKIQKDMESAIASALAEQHSDSKKADPKSHQKTAAAIAQGVTEVIVAAIQGDAEVLPGIPVAGAGPTAGPGKIF